MASIYDFSSIYQPKANTTATGGISPLSQMGTSTSLTPKPMGQPAPAPAPTQVQPAVIPTASKFTIGGNTSGTPGTPSTPNGMPYAQYYGTQPGTQPQQPTPGGIGTLPTNGTQSPIAPNGSTLDPSQSTLSPNFDQYVYNMLARGEQAANAPYQPYTGNRFAGASNLQNQAFQGIGGLSMPGQYGQAGQAFTNVLNGPQYDASNPNTVAQFMSPYMQNVVDANKREAIRSDQIAQQGRNAQAVGSGAFGGSRQGLQEAEAARNLSTQLGDIQNKGQQSAFDSAMSAINASRTSALNAGQGLSSLGTAQNAAQLNNLGAQMGAGATQNSLAQQPLDFGYAQWQESMNYPQVQAQNMQKLLSGLPLQANQYQSGDSAINSLLSGGLGALSLYNLFNPQKAGT